MSIVKLKPANISELFKHEAQHFTPWLLDNIDALAERLGIELTAIEREKTVGSFKLDILASGPNGEMVIIEGQLNRTDHDHLGKVLTYLVNLDAKTAIWVTREVRPEHVQVVEWLNDNTPQDVRFYLVKVEAFSIGKDLLAPLFTVLVGPTEIGKAIGKVKKDIAKSAVKYRTFWELFIKRSQGKTHLLASRKTSKDNWIGVSTGRSGFTYEYLVYEGRAVIRLYIDVDKNTGEGNKKLFDQLKLQKKAIEVVFGEPLEWDRRDGARYSCVKYTLQTGIKNEADWERIHKWMLDSSNRLDKAIHPHVMNLKV